MLLQMMDLIKMKRGEIYFADLNPTVGHEVKKKRPVLIVSNDANNRAAKTVTVIPLTSNIEKIYPFEVLLKKDDSGLTKNAKAQCNQIRTISKLRMQGKKVGALNQKKMLEINSSIKLHLDMF